MKKINSCIELFNNLCEEPNYLCHEIIDGQIEYKYSKKIQHLFELVSPVEGDTFYYIDRWEMKVDRARRMDGVYGWAYDGTKGDEMKFNPLRQNIVLLMAAMNNEL